MRLLKSIHNKCTMYLCIRTLSILSLLYVSKIYKKKKKKKRWGPKDQPISNKRNGGALRG